MIASLAAGPAGGLGLKEAGSRHGRSDALDLVQEQMVLLDLKMRLLASLHPSASRPRSSAEDSADLFQGKVQH